MESIIKLRIILDATEDIFRDIEIDYDAPLMHLHLATLDAFEWNNANEMASFYKSNEEWDDARREEVVDNHAFLRQQQRRHFRVTISTRDEEWR